MAWANFVWSFCATSGPMQISREILGACWALAVLYRCATNKSVPVESERSALSVLYKRVSGLISEQRVPRACICKTQIIS